MSPRRKRDLAHKGENIHGMVENNFVRDCLFFYHYPSICYRQRIGVVFLGNHGKNLAILFTNAIVFGSPPFQP